MQIRQDTEINIVYRCPISKVLTMTGKEIAYITNTATSIYNFFPEGLIEDFTIDFSKLNTSCSVEFATRINPILFLEDVKEICNEVVEEYPQGIECIITESEDSSFKIEFFLKLTF